MLRRLVVALEFCASPTRRKISLDLIAQRLDQPRHGNQQRDALFPNRPRYFCRVQRVEKDRRPAQNLRQKNPEQLSEYMAQRQKIEKSQRMNESFVSPVLRDLLLDRRQICQQVPVRQHDAARLRRGARCKYNFNRVSRNRRSRGKIANQSPACAIGQLFEEQRIGRPQRRRESVPHDRKLHPGLLGDSPRESLLRNRVHRHPDRALKHASQKCRDPLARVLSPNQNAVALRDSPRPQYLRKARGSPKQLAISPSDRPIAAPPHYCNLIARPGIGTEVFEQRLSRHGPEFPSFASRLEISLHPRARYNMRASKSKSDGSLPLAPVDSRAFQAVHIKWSLTRQSRRDGADDAQSFAQWRAGQ